MAAGESQAHLELKRLALIWAQAAGYSIAACEVSLPHLRCRMDVGTYRPGAKRGEWRGTRAEVGVTAIFECKASRPDLVRDCRNSERLLARMKTLSERRATL